jgi:hypothetical protein
MRHANIELEIDRLILPDLPMLHRSLVTAAIEQELTRLITEQGIPRGVDLHEALTFPTSTVEVESGAKPAAIGAQVAQSIYRNLAVSRPPVSPRGGTKQ